MATLLTTTHGHNSSYDVWEIWRNRTGVYNDTNQDGSFGYVLLIGLLGSLFAFSGYEAGAHMAEETTNASKSAPWGIVLTCVMVAVVGFMYILGLLYSIPPSLGVFTSLTTYGNAASSLFAVAKGNNVGLILTNVLVANLFFAGMSSFTVTSRICFASASPPPPTHLRAAPAACLTNPPLLPLWRAVARDGAIPYGHRFAGVWKRTKTPIGSVALTLVLDCLILLLPLTTSGETFGATNPVAFNAVTSSARARRSPPRACRATRGCVPPLQPPLQPPQTPSL